MATWIPTRTTQRDHLTDKLRIERLEEDADGFDRDLVAVTQRLERLTIAAWSVAGSLLVASVTMAVTMTVR